MLFHPRHYDSLYQRFARLFQRRVDPNGKLLIEVLRASDGYRDEIGLATLYRLDPQAGLQPGRGATQPLYAGFVAQNGAQPEPTFA